jgi:hypothetical protein
MYVKKNNTVINPYNTHHAARAVWKQGAKESHFLRYYVKIKRPARPPRGAAELVKKQQPEVTATEPTAAKEPTTDSSPFSFFYSIIPKDILGVPVTEIRKDLADSHTQITSLWVSPRANWKSKQKSQNLKNLWNPNKKTGNPNKKCNQYFLNKIRKPKLKSSKSKQKVILSFWRTYFWRSDYDGTWRNVF